MYFFNRFYLLKFLKLLLSVDKLEVSGTPEDIGFAIGQADAEPIQEQKLQPA